MRLVYTLYNRENCQNCFVRLSLVLLVFGCSVNLGVPSYAWAADGKNIVIEFHIAADPCKDAALVNVARQASGVEVWQNSALVARWIPVAKNATPLPTSDKIVTRAPAKDDREILVLITDDDIVDSKILKLSLSMGQYGETVVQVNVADSGGEPGFYNLTKDKMGRYIVAVADGQALNALKLTSVVNDVAVIPGSIGEELAGRILNDKRFKETTVKYAKTAANHKATGHFSNIVIAAIIIVFSLFGLGAIKLLSQKKPDNSKSFRLWMVTVTIIGIVVGAYILGVSKSWGSMQTPDDQSVLARRMEIRLVDVFAGAIAGGILSYFIMCLLSLRKSIGDTKKERKRSGNI